MYYTCIKKYRDRNGVITGYDLADSFWRPSHFKAEVVKMLIKQGKIEVDNLKLTSDGRLIDVGMRPNNRNEMGGDIIIKDGDSPSADVIGAIIIDAKDTGCTRFVTKMEYIGYLKRCFGYSPRGNNGLYKKNNVITLEDMIYKHRCVIKGKRNFVESMYIVFMELMTKKGINYRDVEVKEKMYLSVDDIDTVIGNGEWTINYKIKLKVQLVLNCNGKKGLYARCMIRDMYDDGQYSKVCNTIKFTVGDINKLLDSYIAYLGIG